MLTSSIITQPSLLAPSANYQAGSLVYNHEFGMHVIGGGKKEWHNYKDEELKRLCKGSEEITVVL